MALALNSGTNLFVADAFAHTIRVVSAVGTNWVAATIGGLAWKPGDQDGTGSDARFNLPGGIAVDDQDHLYIADTGNDTIRFGDGNVVVVTPPPSVFLNVSQSGSQLILSWPASASGYQLESNPGLDAANWTPTADIPAPSGGNLVVTNDTGGSMKFYRLHKP